MKLHSIEIKNYRSIESVILNTDSLNDDSFTYGLIGENEAGKSNILKALALADGLKNSKGEKLPILKDFRDRGLPIEIKYKYELQKEETEEILSIILKEIPDSEFDNADVALVMVNVSYLPQSATTRIVSIEFLDLIDVEFPESVRNKIQDYIWSNTHMSIFWTAEDRYLISQPINIAEFSANPTNVSIPLFNCFALAGMDSEQKIRDRLSLIKESTEREGLEDELGDVVTSHINEIWHNHPITITFEISETQINFHVHDKTSKSKAKTADQRSDGFGQFVSFLLTISAQNKNNDLSNSILLVDEPETHLHPRAQINLLNELVSITQNKQGNLAFFATHSNYMIDKSNLSRNYRVTKEVDKKTERENTMLIKFDNVTSSYAGVTFEVFDIPTTDYHNELYSKLHEIYQMQDTTDTLRSQILNFDQNYLQKQRSGKPDKPWWNQQNMVTSHTYIRNCIHHSDNGNVYKETDLRKSIELLRDFLDDERAKANGSKP